MARTDYNREEMDRETGRLQERLDILSIVLDESTDPIFNILEDGTYRYVNMAFARPFKMLPAEIIGRRIWDIFSADEAAKRMEVVKRAFSTGETIVFDVRVPTETGDLFFITSVKPVKDEKGRVTSVICISKDITERKKIEQEREKLILDLRGAMAKIRTLSGMFPICAGCKRIRNDQGYWTQIETYLRDHSDAEFSHGLCPDCAKKLYPRLDLTDK